MKKNRFPKLKSKHYLVIMTIIALGFIITSLASDKVAYPIRAVAGYIITPFQNGINDIGNFLTDTAAGWQDVRELAAENKELKQQIDTLTEQNNQLLQAQKELARLEELYRLDEAYSDYPKVAAQVISKDPGNWYSTFVIDKGTADGISVDMNVIGQGGLIGIVTETGSNWAQVRSIIDDESNVSVMLSKSSETFMISGSLLEKNNGRLNFFQLNDTDEAARAGDAVVTSHISSKFLPGILVGYISDISLDANKLTKSGTLVPVADFTDLREVLVITELKQTKENS